MSLTWAVFDPTAVAETGPWLRLLVGFDVIYTLLGMLVMEPILTSGLIGRQPAEPAHVRRDEINATQTPLGHGWRRAA